MWVLVLSTQIFDEAPDSRHWIVQYISLRTHLLWTYIFLPQCWQVTVTNSIWYFSSFLLLTGLEHHVKSLTEQWYWSGTPRYIMVDSSPYYWSSRYLWINLFKVIYTRQYTYSYDDEKKIWRHLPYKIGSSTKTQALSYATKLAHPCGKVVICMIMHRQIQDQHCTRSF